MSVTSMSSAMSAVSGTKSVEPSAPVETKAKPKPFTYEHAMEKVKFHEAEVLGHVKEIKRLKVLQAKAATNTATWRRRAKEYTTTEDDALHRQD